jgi:CubicO group peptidase (beta-lactamase class C family)
MPIDADALSAIAARFASRGGQPGLAYGVIAGGILAHAGGHGERWLGGSAPDADTVFRIASMTKSFTAALVLKLRDTGALSLDDPAVDYVPVLSRVARPTADSPPITIRHLLTMTAGFPTDDPWGDRQQGLDPAAFTRLLADGEVRTAWAPGTKFEYSNLGYAILGLIIESVTGLDYAEAMQTELLGPLMLSRTGYQATEVEPTHLARGYRRKGREWLELTPDPYGAFAPMGGIFSSVRDMARWVAGFAAVFPPGPLLDSDNQYDTKAESGDADHPLGRVSRREMQLGQVAITDDGSGVVARFAGPTSMSYGFGLFAEDDPAFGTVVQHSGGYPGFGSHMRWHPATGLGTVVLANSTYAHAGVLAAELLSALLSASTGLGRERGSFRPRGPFPAGAPWPQTVAAREKVSDLLADWSDETAARIFAPNIELDRPLAQRRAEIERLRERIGAFESDPSRPAEFDSPAHCRWWLTGDATTVAVQIRLPPLRQPIVQQLIIAIPPARGSALAEALDLLIAGLSVAEPCWPAGLAAADGFSPDWAARQLGLAAAWIGPGALDSYLAGDGETGTTVRLHGPNGRATLAVEITESGAVSRCEVTLLG